VLLLVPLGVALSPRPLGAEVYKWVDENGTIHYSQDRNTLPKKAADRAPSADAQPVEVFEFKKRSGSEPSPQQSYTIYMRGVPGGNHVIQVELNRRVTVPMLLDTGASDVVITRAAALRAGITERDYRGMETYSTANGPVTQPAISLREVSVGGASAKMVRGSISDSMEIGLLGTSFLKHFEYSIKGSELILVPRE
jgi:clan AA aspartic protease (TIGR02281 family)